MEKKLMYVLVGLLIVIEFQVLTLTCSNSIIKRKVFNIENKIETNTSATQDYILKTTDSLLNLNRYIILRDMLYDQNAIVRTVVRPDDRINYYNKEIEKIIKK
jgi:hypothetical protein